MQNIFMAVIKDLLVGINTGEDIYEHLAKLEEAVKLAEPGWSVADELRARYKTEKDDDVRDPM